MKFDPETVQLTGTGPFVGAISIENTDGHATARGVVIGLIAGQGAQFLSSIEFGNGQVWQIGGSPGFTLYAAGDIAPGAEVQIAFTIDATPAWLDKTPPLTARIALGIASAQLRSTPGECDGEDHPASRAGQRHRNGERERHIDRHAHTDAAAERHAAPSPARRRP